MTVEETIKKAMINYPSLFPTKYDVLEHLFLVNGNGYDWENGQLIAIFGHAEKSNTAECAIKLAQDFIDGFKPYEDVNEFAKQIITHTKIELLIEELTVLNNFEENYKKTSDEYLKNRNRAKLYPADFGFCKIGKIPENIQDDWREAVVQYIDFLDHHQEILDEQTLKQWDKFIEVKNNLIKK